MTNSYLPLRLKEIRDCQDCKAELPLGPRPIVQAHQSAKVLIIGQAPGSRVHESGIPWDDPSGKRLRAWLGVEPNVFYDPSKFAIMPMGFCYPGKGKTGDRPPRKECAPKWHNALLKELPNVELTLLIGQYSQQYYLTDTTHPKHHSLTARVKAWELYTPDKLPLPHPSPRNQIWLKKNPWFEDSVVPWLKQTISAILNSKSAEQPVRNRLNSHLN